MDTVHFKNQSSNPGHPPCEGVATIINPVISATENVLPEHDQSFSNNQTTSDEKLIILSRSAMPATASFYTISHHPDTQIETDLYYYIQERNINPIYLETLKVILASENTRLSQIPPVDLQNMLRSLHFSQVSKEDDCFDQYNIKLIKTGTVFFTWTALTGTSIFNGNNHPYKINYVEHIIQTAGRLDQQQHPVLVIYSNRSMSERCIQEMDAYFTDHPNIISLCKERDLGLRVTGKHDPLHRNDHLRLEILNAQKKVIRIAIEQARKAMKSPALNNLLACQNSSLVYSDMDNHFLRIPEYLIAFDGAIDATILNSLVIEDIEQYPGLYSLTQLDSRIITLKPDASNTTEENNAIAIIDSLLKNSKSKPNKEQNTKELLDHYYALAELAVLMITAKASQTLTKIKNTSLQNELDTINTNGHLNGHLNNEELHEVGFFYGDNGFILCTPQNNKLKETFNKSCHQCVSQIKFHCSENETNDSISAFYNQHYLKANSLAGYQLIDSVIIGHDGTWTNKSSSATFNYLINQEKIRISLYHSHCLNIFRSIKGSAEEKIFKLTLPDAPNV